MKTFARGSEITTAPNAFVFMKVGMHAGETFDEILRRKNAEFAKAGKIFWGYGGPTLHPITQVQPFARTLLETSGAIYVLMQSIDSHADPDIVPATEYSSDAVTWKPIPDGIRVTGSRYALVLDEIKPGDLEIVLEDYQIALGNSRGKNAAEYLRGHVDKACLMRSGEGRPASLSIPKIRKVEFLARLQEPYAVLLK
jgi:hypothetical protein